MVIMNDLNIILLYLWALLLSYWWQVGAALVVIAIGLIVAIYKVKIKTRKGR